MSDIQNAIKYFSDAITETDETFADCSPALQVELIEQKRHFVVAIAALERQTRVKPIDSMFCPNCKTDLLDRVNFCGYCGQKIIWEPEAQTCLN